MRIRNVQTGEEMDVSDADFAAIYSSRGFAPADDEDAQGGWKPAAAPAPAVPAAEATEAPADLSAMTRDELEAHAASVGVADPASFPNKAALVQAIEAAQPPQE